MVHRTEVLLRRGFALLLFTGVTQASNSVPGTWWMCDGYLLSEAKNQKATRQASAELANLSLHTQPCSVRLSIFSVTQWLVSSCH